MSECSNKCVFRIALPSDCALLQAIAGREDEGIAVLSRGSWAWRSLILMMGHGTNWSTRCFGLLKIASQKQTSFDRSAAAVNAAAVCLPQQLRGHQLDLYPRAPVLGHGNRDVVVCFSLPVCCSKSSVFKGNVITELRSVK